LLEKLHGVVIHAGCMTDAPHPIDVHVGLRVRLRRTLLGMTQDKLASALGITFQQVQKYERGSNRIVASRLYEMSQVLDVPVSYFFEGAGDAPAGMIGLAEDPAAAYEVQDVLSRETLELVRAYRAVESPLVRQRVVDLLRAIGHAPASDADGQKS
jgi:transcriptional regulator with XRE-family HTH domain